MKKTIIAGLTLAVAASLGAQTAAPATAPAPGDKIVATVNGEVITRAKLDFLYDRMGAQMKAQYEKSGGKMAFLENYLRKRLVIQEALKSAFDERANVKAEMDAAKESALFDLYIRDVVAADLISAADLRNFYDANREQFATPEGAKLRHIVISSDTGPRPKSKEEARQMISNIAAELAPHRPPQGASATAIEAFRNRFAEAARRYSEDGVAPEGGDLGWVTRDGLDAQFAAAAFALPKGALSNVVESAFGYHLIFVEDRRAAGHEPYESARSAIREIIMREKAAEIMGVVSRLTNELRNSSKIAIHRENVQ